MNGGPQLARKKEKEEPEEAESWEEEDDEELPKKQPVKGKLPITVFIAVMVIALMTASVILFSMEKEDADPNKDTKAPSISLIEPPGGSIIYRGENITVIVDVGEDDAAVPTVRGRLSSIDHSMNFNMKSFNYTGNNKWSGIIEIPDDLDLGEWHIWVEALDLAGNKGSINVSIVVR